MVHVLDEVGRFSDVELVRRLEQLLRADRALSAKLLVHLGEVEARDLHRARSFSSMSEYCRSELGMSEGEAGLRILAARVCRKFPLVLERLGTGALTLTAIRLIAPHLTAENHVQLLDRVRGMPKRKIEVLVAELAPKPDVPARMRRLPEPRSTREPSHASTSVGPRSTSNASAQSGAAATNASACGTLLASVTPVPSTPLAAAMVSLGATPAAQAVTSDPSSSVGLQPAAAQAALVLRPRRARATITPLSPGRFDLRLGQQAHDALEQLVELFRHQNPTGDMTSIVERALCELLKREMKRRFGQSDATEQQGTREPAAAARTDVAAKPARAAKPDVEARSAAAVKPDVEAKPAHAATPELEVQATTLDVQAKSSVVEAKTKRHVGSVNSRHIPQQVRREVFARDEGQCTFVSRDGRRCTERGFLEVHHHNTTFCARRRSDGGQFANHVPSSQHVPGSPRLWANVYAGEVARSGRPKAAIACSGIGPMLIPAAVRERPEPARRGLSLEASACVFRGQLVSHRAGRFHLFRTSARFDLALRRSAFCWVKVSVRHSATLATHCAGPDAGPVRTGRLGPFGHVAGELSRATTPPIRPRAFIMR